MKTTAILSLIALIALSAIAANPASAELRMDSINFDPAIIASGDEVDIVVQFHHEGNLDTETHIGDPDYRFAVSLIPENTLAKEHILITDGEGRDLQGIINRGEYYNKRFTVKVADNAPAGTYEFKIAGQWTKNGQPIGSEQYLRFDMPVKREGIALSVANVVSMPEKVRSGDKEVLLTTSIANTGEKAAKNVRISLTYPEGITSSYTNNNDLYIGTLDPMQSKEVQLYIDTDRFISEGVYPINYTMSYQDLESNSYTTSGSFPFVIKKKPDIVVTSSDGTGLAGEEITLRIVVENRGEETADAVDIRILKQSSQPFEMDVRSDYIGRLEPGETGTAVFTMQAKDDAELKEHKFTVLIRAKGDATEGDDNIYTFTDAVTVDLTGERENRWPLYAGVFAIGVIGLGAGTAVVRKRK